MQNQHAMTPEGFRTAAYLEARARLDARRKTSGKIKCKLPNRQCGNRCIPPQWNCRVKGEGTDSHSRVIAGDPLAGAASIARGRDRLAKGLKTGNITEIQAGRAAIARGIVKSVPGQKLKEKQNLRKGIESAIMPIATGLFAAWAIRQGHEGAKLLFPTYAKGPARDVEDAANNGIGFVLDRIPIYGGYRQALRENASAEAQVLGKAIYTGVKSGPTSQIGSQQSFIDVSRQKVAGLKTAILDSLKVRESDGDDPIKYSNFRSNVLSGVIGVKENGNSIYAEPATINLLAKQYGIKYDSILGADNTARKSFLIAAVASKLSIASESMRADMSVRGLDYKKPEDVDRYATIANNAAVNRFKALSSNQQDEALGTLQGTVRDLVSPSKAPQPTRQIATRLYKETLSGYNEYYKQAAQRIKEDTSTRSALQFESSADIPRRSTLIGVAEQIKKRVGIKAPITGANHAELVLQKVYHEAAVPLSGFSSRRKTTWTATDADIKFAAQDLGWDGAGEIKAAFGVIQRSGQFPNLVLTTRNPVTETRKSTSVSTGRQRSAQRRPASTAQRVAAYIKAGYSEETARRKAAEDEARLKQDSLEDIPTRVMSYLKVKALWSS